MGTRDAAVLDSARPTSLDVILHAVCAVQETVDVGTRTKLCEVLWSNDVTDRMCMCVCARVSVFVCVWLLFQTSSVVVASSDRIRSDQISLVWIIRFSSFSDREQGRRKRRKITATCDPNQTDLIWPDLIHTDDASEKSLHLVILTRQI